jgi:hypothetical protein
MYSSRKQVCLACDFVFGSTVLGLVGVFFMVYCLVQQIMAQRGSPFGVVNFCGTWHRVVNAGRRGYVYRA